MIRITFIALFLLLFAAGTTLGGDASGSESQSPARTFQFKLQPAADPTPVLAKSASVVEIFYADWCPACKKAMRWLEANKIAFTAHDVEGKTAYKRMLMMGGDGRIPYAIINGKKILGFTPAQYKQALGMQ